MRIQKPEILLFGDLKASNSHVVLLQAEITIESSRHSYSSSIVCTFTDVRAKSKRQGNYAKQTPYWLLCPCDIEISRKEESPEFNVDYTVTVNAIDIHVSAEIIHTFIDVSTNNIFHTYLSVIHDRFQILNEATSFLDSMHLKAEEKSFHQDFNAHFNLWTPKKISKVPYKKINDGKHF